MQWAKPSPLSEFVHLSAVHLSEFVARARLGHKSVDVKNKSLTFLDYYDDVELATRKS